MIVMTRPATPSAVPPTLFRPASVSPVSMRSAAGRRWAMGRPIVLLLAALLPVGGPARGQAQAPAHDGDDGPMVVTSDSRAYCLTLAAQIQHYHSMPQEVHDLEDEGRSLCERGRVRVGINRLRRALMVLRVTPQGGGESLDVMSNGEN